MNDITVINCAHFENPTTIDSDRILKASVSDTELLSNLKLMALSSFDLVNESKQSHLRLFETNDNVNNTIENIRKTSDNTLYSLPGVCIHEDCTLEDILELLPEHKDLESVRNLTFLLAPNVGPYKSNNEITLKCILEETPGSSSVSSDEKFVEVIICLNNTRVSDLTDNLVEKMNLSLIDETSPDQYYLKTLNWLGDTESILNDVNSLCLDVPLKHNDLLVLSRGKLVPPNHYKLNIWQDINTDLNNKLQSIEISENNNDVIFNDFIISKFQGYQLVDDLIVKNDLTLDDLQIQIRENLLKIIEENVNIGLRVMRKLGKSYTDSRQFQLKKSLFDLNKTLKQLNLKPENDLYVHLIADEVQQSLNQGILVC